MKNFLATGTLSVILSIGSLYVCNAQGRAELPSQSEMYYTLQAVAQKQMADFTYSTKGAAFHLQDYGINSWTNATFLFGLADWSNIVQDPAPYREWLIDIGNKANWKLPSNFIYLPPYSIYHADEINMGQFYFEMYKIYKDEEMLADTRGRLDAIIDYPRIQDMSHDNKQTWSWCDALFMAPAVYIQMSTLTGNSKYIDFMNEEFLKTYNHLYSPADSLFFRDDSYFGKTESNGKKIFWGRGNGWVAAGLANMLKHMPKASPYRPFYEELFVKLCTRLARSQNSKGFWHASLLNPEAYPSPETSATSLITYALAYGINNQLLDRKTFYPIVVKAWGSLADAIDPDGRLGWVQPIGADPKTVTREMSVVYGPGALLLAGKELLQLNGKFDAQSVTPHIQGRAVVPFNNDWMFKKGPFEKDMIQFANDPFSSDQSFFAGYGEPVWEAVTTPHTWNDTDMQTASNNFHAGDAYYRKSYTPALSLKDKRIFLRFEGVASTAHLYINGHFAGKHEGAYSAFAIEISSFLKFGKPNEILVKANNAPRPDVIPVNHFLFGVYGGIYRPVSLVITEKANIAVTDYASPGIYISQKEVGKKSASIGVRTKLENKYNRRLNAKLVTTIYEADGRIKDRLQIDVTLSPQGRQTFEQQFVLRNPHLWQGLEDPYLYKVVTQLIDQQNKTIDEVTQPLGVRHIELRQDNNVYLNGQHVPMYGVCRHQDRWQVGSALTNAHHDEDLAIIREMGTTTIRLAHYQQAEYFYAKCDSIGFLVWAEIPFVNRVTMQEADNAHRQLKELIRQNYNHPSIYVWGLHNEVMIPENYTAEVTAELHDLAKTEDPGRYTVAVNGDGQVDHPVNMQADIQGINRYFGWYGYKMQDLEPWLQGVKRDFPHHQVILSEYGAEANIYHQDETIGESGTCCGFDHFYNENFSTRLHEKQWGYIANAPHLAASYIWNMFDFCTPMSAQGGVPARNMKGMVTFDRKTKKDVFYWYKANWSKEPVVYITGRRNTERYQAVTPVTVYSNIGRPVLLVNGKEIKSVQQGTTNVHYIFENVNLVPGKNVLEVKVERNGTVYQDQIVWFYSPDNKAVSKIPEE